MEHALFCMFCDLFKELATEEQYDPRVEKKRTIIRLEALKIKPKQSGLLEKIQTPFVQQQCDEIQGVRRISQCSDQQRLQHQQHQGNVAGYLKYQRLQKQERPCHF